MMSDNSQIGKDFLKCVIDIETTLDHKIIHMVGVYLVDTHQFLNFREPHAFNRWVKESPRLQIIGHNVIGFDIPTLERVWGVSVIHLVNDTLRDTLVMSRLLDPSIEGGHSLKAWGDRLAFKKDTDASSVPGFFDKYSPEMESYCRRDCELTARLYEYLSVRLEVAKFSNRSIELEHQVAHIISGQEQNGFQLDVGYASELVDIWTIESDILHEELVATFEPTTVVLKTKIKQVPFNPGSRDQIADRLIKRGWKPTKFTPTNKPVVDDVVLETVDIPEAKKIHQYMLLNKRIAQVQSWIDAADDVGKVHGKVITNGAITGRMTHHSPNMAQIPSVASPYGKECRECWIPDQSCDLVGIDAKALELCMLAHYMDDEDYTKAVVSGSKDDGTDIHSVNQRAAGLSTRDQAKTFIYAFLYGAGPEKIGSIIGGDAAAGRRLIQRFLEQTPALAKLKSRVSKALKESSTLRGLDGRRLIVRSEHSALNTLLQGAGAVVMKQALVLFDQELKRQGFRYKFVANVHDEWQLSVPIHYASLVGECGVSAIREAGKILGLRCPLDGAFAIGKNWAKTH